MVSPRRVSIRRVDPERTERAGPGWISVTAVVLVLSFAFLGSRGLGDPDEGRYAAAAHEMLEGGSFITPTLEGAPHLTKPPLTYWATAAGLALFGPNAWGARAATGAAHAATALCLAALCAACAGDRRGLWAGIVYATMLMPFAAASLVTPDPLLVLFETAAIAGLWCATTPGRDRRLWGPLAGIALGLAFATKGPVGLMPLAVFGVACVLDRSRRLAGALPGLLHPAGPLLFVAIAMPWFVLADAAHPGLIARLLGDELVGRAVTGGHGRNAAWYQPLKLWLLPLTLGCLPWPLFWLRSRVATRPAKRSADPARVLAWTWIVLPVVVFALLPTRQVLYILPVFPAIALATVLSWTGPSRRAPRRGRLIAVAGTWIVLLLALRAGTAAWPSHRDTRRLAGLVAAELRSAEGDAAWAIAAPNLHGVGFYLDQRPSRDARALLTSDADRIVILTREERRETLVRHADRAGRSVRIVSGPRDVRIVVAGPAGDNDQDQPVNPE